MRLYDKDSIIKRYKKANEQAITMNNSIGFDSLRDVFYLVNERETFIKKITELENIIEGYKIVIDQTVSSTKEKENAKDF